MISFQLVEAFYLLPLPFILYRFLPSYLCRKKAIKVPFFSSVTKYLNIKLTSGSNESMATSSQKGLIILGWFMLVLAASEPTLELEPKTYERYGRDLMLVVDLSGSMATLDYKNSNGQSVTRLETAKTVLKAFSQNRSGDRLGLILFGDAPFIQAPFTSDHPAWLELLNQSQVAMAGESTRLGDAIGLGIKTYVNQESTGNSQQKVMIVLTDGNDTDSMVPPIDAAKVAAAKGIRIYMVAMGSLTSTGDESIDMEVIRRVSEITGGQSFLANSPQSLAEIYQIIDTLEPNMFESVSYQQTLSVHHLPIIMIFTLHLMFIFVATVKRLLKIQPLGSEHVD